MGAKCTYVEETHGKYYVKYFSNFLGYNKKRVEISDLLFIVYEQKSKTIRLCNLQAKYRKDGIGQIEKIRRMNVFQWELLENRPIIENVSKAKYCLPINVLNFNSYYKTISAYGIFYKDYNGDIDFLFTIPELLRSVRPLTNISLKRGYRTFKFEQSQPGNLQYNKDEKIVADSMDCFEEALGENKIGAPVIGPDLTNILELLSYANLKVKKENGNEESAIDIILKAYKSKFDRKLVDNIKLNLPAMMILTINSENKEKIGKL